MLKKVTFGPLIMAIICYVGNIATGTAIIYSLCFIMLIGVIGFGLLVFLCNKPGRTTNWIHSDRFNYSPGTVNRHFNLALKAK